MYKFFTRGRGWFFISLLAFLLNPASLLAASVYINEIHYDNEGTDTGEFVEIAGQSGTDLTGWSVVFYNGNGGGVYGTENLSGTIPDNGVVSIAHEGIQNGAPDGLALVDADDTVIQFLSYEGSFTATEGVASGMTSEDIEVAESASTPAGHSLQFSGSAWASPASSTKDEPNFNLIDDDDNTPPTLSSTTPANGATEVALNSDLSLQFNENVQKGTAYLIIKLADDDSEVASIAFDSDQVAVNGDEVTCNLSNDLNPETNYYIELEQGAVKDVAGNVFEGFSGKSTWGFTTAAASCSATADIFISEYIEGSSYNKALELYNPTDTAIDLAAGNYSLAVYYNGSTDLGDNTLKLTGTIASQGTLIMANAQADGAVTDNATTGFNINFNGDDTIILNKGAKIIDVIGQLGTDPGTEWINNDVSTKDQTLRRKSTVTSGDTNPDDVFDPSVEWQSFAKDSFDGLGHQEGAACDPSGDDTGDSTIVKIHKIQGSGLESGMQNQSVIIEGIVVGDFQDTLEGFFVQEEDSDVDNDPTTSEGIFVYHAATAVEMGDKVKITGKVIEYHSLTQISDSVTVEIVDASHDTLPTAASVILPLDDKNELEHFEGMAVTFPQTLYVTNTYNLGRYGKIVLSSGDRLQQPTNVTPPGSAANALQAKNDLNRIVLDDGDTTQNPDPTPHGLTASDTIRGGDTVTGLSGVLSYGYDKYRLQPTQSIDFTATNPRPMTPPDVGGHLKVASFNVLNYFINFGSNCAPTGNQDCRGADNQTEFNRQRAKIIDAIIKMNADIVGLMEVENTNATAGLQDLINGLNAKAGTGIYQFINTGTIGSDAIRVGLIYKPATVTPVGNHAILDNSVDPTFIDTKNRPSLAQTFQQTASGEKVIVVVNHFKSKGSNCDALGDPDAGDGQGNCNLTRRKAALAVHNWLATDPTGSGDEDFLLIGDFNAYAKEDPITALEAKGYINEVSGYSYSYDGQWGSLDHALASSHLHPQVIRAKKWHINADEPKALDYNTEFKSDAQIDSLYNADPFRASDHDPIIVGLSLNETQSQTITQSQPSSTTTTSHPYTAPQPGYHRLYVGSPSAYIKSKPAGIDCDYGDGQCFANFPRGTTVTLYLAEPLPDSLFAVWRGDLGCEKQTLRMFDIKECLVHVYGRPENTSTLNADNKDVFEHIPNTALNIAHGSAIGQLRGNEEDLFLGFILKGTGESEITAHAQAIDSGVVPMIKLNQLEMVEGHWQGKTLYQTVAKAEEDNEAIFSKYLNKGAYTLQMSSQGRRGQGMSSLTLNTPETMKLTNISVRGYLQGHLILNFMLVGEAQQTIEIQTQQLIGDFVPKLQLLKLPTSEIIPTAATSAEDTVTAKLMPGTYAAVLMATEGEGVGMINVDLVE